MKDRLVKNMQKLKKKRKIECCFNNVNKMEGQMKTILESYGKKLVDLVAQDLATKELKKGMTKGEIKALLSDELLNGNSEESDESDDVSEIEIVKSELPPKISIKKAQTLLKMCQRGVEKGMYIHFEKQTVVKPTTQQSKFHRNEKARIFGPAKYEEAIEWLAKKAGRVGEPKPRKVKPILPDDWNENKLKKLKNHIICCPEDKMVMAFSSRKIEFNDAKHVANEKYNLIAANKDKEKFMSFCAYLDTLPDWQDIERSPEETPKKKAAPKKKTTTKKPAAKKTTKKNEGRGKKKPVEEEDETEREATPVKPTRKTLVKTPIEDDDDDDESSATIVPTRGVAGTAPAALGDDDDDETDIVAEDDEEEEEDDEFDYAKIRKSLPKIREDQYLDVYTCKGVAKDSDPLFAYDDHSRLAVRKQHNERATKALFAKIRNNIE